MLIGDVLGLPLLPWLLAEPIGKAAAKLKKKIPQKTKEAKKRAKRAGANADERAAAVLRRRVTLVLPSAEEIKAPNQNHHTHPYACDTKRSSRHASRHPSRSCRSSRSAVSQKRRQQKL